jgi:hypothetical protein
LPFSTQQRGFVPILIAHNLKGILDGIRPEAAGILGVSRTTLYKLLEQSQT